MTDMHIHTEFSHDSNEKAEHYLSAAADCGDRAVGLVDHFDRDMREYDPMFPLPDLKERRAALDAAAARYPQVRLLRGIELGYSAWTESYYTTALDKSDLDYIIMSVHTVSGRGDCFFPAYFDGLAKRDAYALYLDAVHESVRSNVDFDIVGHIGYVARYSPYKDKSLVYADFPEMFDKILTQIINRGLCLELNTSGGGGDGFVTDKSILSRYAELGGTRFTFGSDAHAVTRYNDGRDKVKRFLSSVGIDHTYRFENRKPIKEYLN